MEYVKFGRLGLKVSRLTFGTVSLGRLLRPTESFRLLDEVIDTGINFIDTADEYASGFSERIIGDWLKQNPGKRDKIVLASKVFERVGSQPNDEGLSAYHIKRACEASLKRLQTDHLDVYQMHHIDRHTPWPEVWQAMSQLIQEGKITYVGSSNFAAWHIAQAQAYAEQRGFLGIASEQSVYNLANRTVELEVLPACQAMGIAFLAYSPLQDGLLAGALSKTKPVADYHSPEHDAKFIGLLEQMEVIQPKIRIHPLTQFYGDFVYPKLQQKRHNIVIETINQPLPEKHRADYTVEVLQQTLEEFGQNLNDDEKQFFIDYGLSRDLGVQTRSTFWRSMLKLERLRGQLERYEAMCQANNWQPAELALAWLSKQAGVTSIIIGARTSRQLHSCISSLNFQLDDELIGKLNEIFPGLRPAPEAYAW